MRYTYRTSEVYVLGKLWMPAVPAATTYTMSSYDVDNARDDDGKLTRESVGLWLDCHSGDFSEVTDWSASIEDGDNTVDIPFDDEDNWLSWSDLMNPEEDY